MGGPVRGWIERVVLTPSRYVTAQAGFKVLYDFFTSHPNYDLIALQYGSTSTWSVVTSANSPGTGTGFFDQPACFGQNAFFVVRANATAARPFDVYHLFQWFAGTGGGLGIAAPGLPALYNGASSNPDGAGNSLSGLMYACAIGIGGTGGSALSPNNGNPWKGTALANGSDTKPGVGPVWGAPSGGGSGVIIFPRSNCGINGQHRNQTQNMGGVSVWNADNARVRWNVVGDDDSFVIFHDYVDDMRYVMTYSGLYTPRNNFNITYPYCTIINDQYLPWSTTTLSVYGDVAGTSRQQGGIVMITSGSVVGLQLDHYNTFTSDANFWPNRTLATPVYDALDIPLGAFEVTPAGVYAGLMGQLDFIREVYNIQTNVVSSDCSRIVIGGSTSLVDRKYAVPWDSATKTAPRSGKDRFGIRFTATALDPNT